MQSVGKQLGIGNLEDFRPHSALVSPDAVGVELELEGFTSRATEEAQRHLHPLWSATTDGSLRNGGVELITNGGLGGEQLFAAFERVAALLERINYDASWRCSTHMHINMRDFTVNQVARFMMVYAACEPVLFAHCGKFRYSSNFCVPVADSLPFHKKLIGRLFDNAVATRSAAQHTVKYTAMNFQPLFGDGRSRPALGTVEFRGGRPMTTVDEFVLQANLLLSIKQFVRESTDSEPDMLTRLNEGVLNTVYANGCAAALEVPPTELDEALVHAWMLLKSYQKGMKSPPPKASNPFGSTAASRAGSQVLNDALENLRATGSPVPDRLSAAQVRDLGYWCAGDMQASQTSPLPRHVGGQSHPRFFSLIGSQVGNGDLTTAQTMVQMAQVLRSEFGFSEDISCHTSVIWALNNSDRSNLGIPTTRATQVICHAVNEAQRGRIPWLHPGKPYNNQPRFTWGAARFGYYDALNEAARRVVARNSNTTSQRDLFRWLLETEVRLKQVPTLLAALEEKGFDGINFPAGQPGAVYAQAGLMMYLLKAAGLYSDDHIHMAHLGNYDRVAAVIEILHDHNLSVPIFKHYSHNGRGLIRCEHTMNTPLGHMVDREVFTNQPQRQSRTSLTTNREVY